MKNILLFLFGSVSGLLFGQDLLAQNPAADTLSTADTIRISPYLGPTSVRALGSFAITTNDKYAFQTNSGFSVMNALRGQTPNLDIGPNYPNAVGGLRSASSLMVIDGLPYASRFSNYYNLNAFEFENIAALSSGNAASVYGGAASGGAFVLESKSGKGFDKGAVEFNSTNSLSWYESQGAIPGLGIGEETFKQWRFTNAIALMKDFGPVDTRVSYTYGFSPNASAPGETNTDTHAFKINTGADIARGLNARLILDHFSFKSTSDYNTSSSSNLDKNLQGNLLLTYKVLDWLTISSQGSLTRLNHDTETNAVKIDAEQTRKFVNLFLSFKKSLGDRFGLSAFSGVQYENDKDERNMQSPSTTGNSMREFSTKTWSAGTGLSYVDALFVDFNYRRDYFSMLPANDNSKPTYSLSSSFNFMDAFHLNSSGFFNARIRGSYGKTHFSIQQGFPMTDEIILQRPNEKGMREVGADLSFLKERITLSTSYFSNSEHVTAVVVIPGSTGYVSTIIDLGDLYVKGWELVLSGASIRRSNLSLDTKLIWSTFKSDLRAEGEVDPTPGSPVLGSSYPDWRGSLLNQFSMGRFFTTFLVDAQKGGMILTYDYSNPVPTFIIVDGTQTRLRDISVGYSLLKNVDGKRIRNAQVSLSCRNIWLIYSKSGRDLESSTIPQKSMSLSLSLLF